MSDLQRVVSQILGDIQGKNTLEIYEANNIMSQRNAGKSNAMKVYSTNVNSAPQMYLVSDQSAKGLPSAEWFNTYGNARAAHSPLTGIVYPKDYGIKLQDLIHEKEHERQLGKNYPQVNKIDENNLDRIYNLMYKHMYSKQDPYKTISGQKQSYEIMPQLRAYEGMLPAGMNLLQSPIGKELPDDLKALYERLKWEQNNIDAMSR